MPVSTNANQANSTQPSPNIDVTSPYTPRRPAPMVSISINHPFATAFRKFKNFLIHKQTLFSTTFSIKITPIVAIVSLFGLATLFGGGITTAFTFGKTVEQKFLSSMPTPTPKVIVKETAVIPAVITVSRAGTIKSTYQLQPTVLPITLIPLQHDASHSGESTPTVSLAPSLPTSPVLHYILVPRSGSIIFLTASSTVHLQSYLNLRVLITGSLDSNKNIITIAKPEDIEILQ